MTATDRFELLANLRRYIEDRDDEGAERVAAELAALDGEPNDEGQTIPRWETMA